VSGLRVAAVTPVFRERHLDALTPSLLVSLDLSLGRFLFRSRAGGRYLAGGTLKADNVPRCCGAGVTEQADQQGELG
jgi:hypothetical protein